MDEQADFRDALLQAQDHQADARDDADTSVESTELVPLQAAGRKPTLARLSPTASFVSQLIAEKHHMSPQRDKRRGSVDTAVDAYAAKAASTVVRMPTGYRKTVIV